MGLTRKQVRLSRRREDQRLRLGTVHFREWGEEKEPEKKAGIKWPLKFDKYQKKMYSFGRSVRKYIKEKGLGNNFTSYL